MKFIFVTTITFGFVLLSTESVHIRERKTSSQREGDIVADGSSSSLNRQKTNQNSNSFRKINTTHYDEEQQQQRNSNRNKDIQAKRDLSLSYSATDIGSKEGTRVKTITVIKNYFDNNNNHRSNQNAAAATTKLNINPELHKSEEWGTKIRDNFDSFGKLPDVPDIDELFEFVNQKKFKEKEKEKGVENVDKGVQKEKGEEKKPSEKNPSSKEKPIEQKPPESMKPEIVATKNGNGGDGKATKGTDSKESEKPVEKTDDTSAEDEDESVEKIQGDAEFLPNHSGKQIKLKSQSLGGTEKYRVHEQFRGGGGDDDDDDVDLEQKQNLQQYYNNYIQPKPYYYPKQNGIDISPSPRPQQGSVSIVTTSGRNYDVPINNNETTGQKPYIAPAIVRKNQLGPSLSQPVNPGNFGPTQIPQLPRGVQPPTPYPTSSQRPYVAPNLRKDCDLSPTANGNNPPPNNQISGGGRAYNVLNQRNPIGTQSPPTALLPPGYSYVQTKIRTGSFGTAPDYRPFNTPRFRGLRIK